MRRFGLLALVLAVVACVAVGCGAGSPNRGANEASGGAPTDQAVDSGTATSRPAVAAAHPDERSSGAIRIGAASDLRRALVALQPAIERACNTRVTFVFGSSGQLKEQILAGADYHLFLSADTDYVAELDRAGRVVPNGSASYAVGRIVLAWRKDLPPLGGVSDLARSDIRRIAIANPAHAPYGRAAEQAMTAAGVWQGVQSRLVLGENIRQATDYVQQGNADAGIVALALVIDTDTPYTLIDASLHKPIIQGAGVVKGTGGERTARCALQQILAPDGQEALQRFGFEPVPAP